MKNRTSETPGISPSKQLNALEMRSSAARVYPFSAIVGQDEMKLALILNVIDPSIGGVLIMGHRGTGKSTAVRGLAELLPEIKVVPGCPYHCDPSGESVCVECSQKLAVGTKLRSARAGVSVVDLPLGATEDRVCGTIDIERALRDGTKTFEPGLLARANRGFLYIDEVNLLEDHLVDLLLDVAVTGCNKVERESISIEHPARFVLIGSGNPEEGELRPQLLDRFGLHVEVKTEDDLDRRVEIVERREAFENQPRRFCAAVAEAQEQLRSKITRAQRSANATRVDRGLLRQIAQLCSDLKIDGHRGEITITRAGRALAGFEGRKKVTEEDVRRVAVMSLRHRLRRDALEETGSTEQIQQAMDKLFPKEQKTFGRNSGDSDGAGGRNSGNHRGGKEIETKVATRRQTTNQATSTGDDSLTELLSESALSTYLPKLVVNNNSRPGPNRSTTIGQGNRNGVRRSLLNYERGRYTRAVSIAKSGARIAIDATLRAAACSGYRVTHDSKRQSSAVDKQRVPTSHTLRFKQLSRKRGSLFILAIDASGSMALNRIRQAKGAALGLLRQSYINRDRIAIVGFRGTSAEILLPASRSNLRARRVLDSLGVGGATPLSAALVCSLQLAKRARITASRTILLLFTDGGANVPIRHSGTTTPSALPAWGAWNGARSQRRGFVEKELRKLGSELKKEKVRTIVLDSQNGFRSSGEAREVAAILGAELVRIQFQNASSGSPSSRSSPSSVATQHILTHNPKK